MLLKTKDRPRELGQQDDDYQLGLGGLQTPAR